MKIITYNMIIEINKIMNEKGMDFKIHLSDACGGQTMWIEELNPDVSMKSNNELYGFLKDYFAEHNMILEYDEEQNSLWTK